MIWGMIRGPRSLLARILLWHGVAMALTASAVSAGVYLFLDLTADQFERQTLRAHVEDIRATIANSSGPVSHDKPQTRSTGPLLAAGMSAIIIDGEGRRSIFAGTPPTLSNARIPRTVTENYFTRRSRRAFYAGLSVPVALPQGRSWIVAFQNLDHPANVMDDIAGQFLRHGLFVIAPLLALLLGIDAYIIRRALKPVRRASALVKTIDPARSNIRVFDPAIPSEVQPLADAINMALTRLTDSLRMQREFTADAAHELRTPITIARVRAAEIADADLRAALIADLDILSGVVGHLLDMAELDSLDQVAMEAVDLAALARQAVATVAPLVFRSGRSIELLGAEREARIIGAPHFLNRALGALLENAVKHTSPGTAIQVRVGSDMISVADDGPGIASGDQGLIFQRFWRRNRSTVANAGLGLAIVQRVVEVHGGSVALCSEPGRTEFILKFAGHPNLKPPFSIRSNKCDDEIPR